MWLQAQLRSELSRMSRAVQDLESQVAVSQDENANLSTGMEELDIQHQEAIRKLVFLSFAFIDFTSVYVNKVWSDDMTLYSSTLESFIAGDVLKFWY